MLRSFPLVPLVFTVPIVSSGSYNMIMYVSSLPNTRYVDVVVCQGVFIHFLGVFLSPESMEGGAETAGASRYSDGVRADAPKRWVV